MIRELKTWVWQCTYCRALSPPIRGIHEPCNPPAGWDRSLEPHCDDWRCTSKEHIDRCPECLIKYPKKAGK